MQHSARPHQFHTLDSVIANGQLYTMPDVLERPAQPPAFLAQILDTPEKARAAGIRSGQVRRERAHAIKAIGTLTPIPDAVQDAVNGQLRLVAEQITRTRRVLNDDTSEWCEHCERGGIQPHHRAQLLKALDSLLDRQRKLLGIPDPGSRKPAPERREPKQDNSPLTPTLPAVTPNVTPALPPKPLGWEYDNPTGTCSSCEE